MFDITSSKLLLLGIVALLVIGPKDFPALLRTIGKYVGIIRGHAKEFRAQFDEAMRESELSELKKDVESLAHETEASFNAAGQSVEKDLADARYGVDASLDMAVEPPPAAGEGLQGSEQPRPAITAASETGAEPGTASEVPDPVAREERAPQPHRPSETGGA
jgi:sec-independent protein translocase protein TatB